MESRTRASSPERFIIPLGSWRDAPGLQLEKNRPLSWVPLHWFLFVITARARWMLIWWGQNRWNSSVLNRRAELNLTWLWMIVSPVIQSDSFLLKVTAVFNTSWGLSVCFLMPEGQHKPTGREMAASVSMCFCSSVEPSWHPGDRRILKD